MARLFCLLCIVFSFAASASYDEGRMAYDQGNYALAYKLWKQVVAKPANEVTTQFGWGADSKQQIGNAQYAIALLYWQGNGVEQDYEQAVKWLRLAIASGQTEAQLKLGYLYWEGKGVDKDEVEARKRFLTAAEYGYIDAQYNLGMMYLLGIGGSYNAAKAKYWLKQAALQGDGQAFDELMKFPGQNVPMEQADGRAGEANVLPEPAIVASKADASLPNNSTFQVREPQWLLSQPAHSYALQVAALQSRQELTEVIVNLPGVAGSWVYFIKKKRNRGFYILLRCCFATAISAGRIKQHLPAELLAMRPFVISLRKVLPFVTHGHEEQSLPLK